MMTCLPAELTCVFVYVCVCIRVCLYTCVVLGGRVRPAGAALTPRHSSLAIFSSAAASTCRRFEPRLLFIPLPLKPQSSSALVFLFFIIIIAPATRLIRPLNWASGRAILIATTTPGQAASGQPLWQGHGRDWNGNRVADRLPWRLSGGGVGSELFLSGERKSLEAVSHSPFPPNTHTHTQSMQLSPTSSF